MTQPSRPLTFWKPFLGQLRPAAAHKVATGKTDTEPEVKMIKALPTDLDMGPVIIRALQSLTKSHMESVAKAVAALPTEWSLNVHDDYDGYLSVIIEPVGHDSATFLLSGTTEKIEVCKLDHDDRMLKCGSFNTIEAATVQLQTLLTEE